MNSFDGEEICSAAVQVVQCPKALLVWRDSVPRVSAKTPADHKLLKERNKMSKSSITVTLQFLKNKLFSGCKAILKSSLLRSNPAGTKIWSCTFSRSFCKIFTSTWSVSRCVCSGHVLTQQQRTSAIHTDSSREWERERSFHSDTEPRCTTQLRSLPPRVLPPPPPLFFSFALSLSYKDTCIPSHSMWSILP